jgi:hypothetical protein
VGLVLFLCGFAFGYTGTFALFSVVGFYWLGWGFPNLAPGANFRLFRSMLYFLSAIALLFAFAGARNRQDWLGRRFWLAIFGGAAAGAASIVVMFALWGMLVMAVAPILGDATAILAAGMTIMNLLLPALVFRFTLSLMRATPDVR